MEYKVNMSALALRKLLGASFDYAAFEHGRKDAKAECLNADPGTLKEKVELVRKVLENADFGKTPGPSYWIGCLEELNFIDK